MLDGFWLVLFCLLFSTNKVLLKLRMFGTVVNFMVAFFPGTHQIRHVTARLFFSDLDFVVAWGVDGFNGAQRLPASGCLIADTVWHEYDAVYTVR